MGGDPADDSSTAEALDRADLDQRRTGSRAVARAGFPPTRPATTPAPRSRRARTAARTDARCSPRRRVRSVRSGCGRGPCSDPIRRRSPPGRAPGLMATGPGFWRGCGEFMSASGKRAWTAAVVAVAAFVVITVPAGAAITHVEINDTFTGRGTIKAPCPKGTHVISGGMGTVNGYGGILLTGSYPYDSRDKGKAPDDGWKVDVTNRGGEETAATRSARSRPSGTSATTSSSPASTTAPAPSPVPPAPGHRRRRPRRHADRAPSRRQQGRRQDSRRRLPRPHRERRQRQDEGHRLRHLRQDQGQVRDHQDRRRSEPTMRAESSTPSARPARASSVAAPA